MSATQYAYKVKDARGRLVEGKVEADTESAVADKLRSMGYRDALIGGLMVTLRTCTWPALPGGAGGRPSCPIA